MSLKSIIDSGTGIIIVPSLCMIGYMQFKVSLILVLEFLCELYIDRRTRSMIGIRSLMIQAHAHGHKNAQEIGGGKDALHSITKFAIS